MEKASETLATEIWIEHWSNHHHHIVITHVLCGGLMEHTRRK